MLHDRKVFFQKAKPLFGSYNQLQVDGLEAILSALEKEPFNEQENAYCLATAYHESAATMQPVRETLANTDEQAAARLEASWKAGKLPWVKTPYWRRDANGQYWFGRGIVQITFKANYARLSPYVGVDLVKNPELALEDDVAIKIMIEGMRLGLFTGKSLDTYIDNLDESDAEDYKEYVMARRIINGTDRADRVAKAALVFERALKG